MKHYFVQFTLLGLVVALFTAVSCSPAPTSTPAPTEPPRVTPAPATPTWERLQLTSSAFESGGMIPKRYSRGGDDISPPLEWSDPPEGTQSFALMVISDPMPDGGGNWVQWILYNIPAGTRTLAEGLTPDADGRLPDGSQHHANSWGEWKYGGPNPPHASTYNYYFTLYALDAKLDLQAVEAAAREEGTLPWIGATKEVFMRAVDGHILALGELVGKYKEQ
jgi:Raf kinase inhibitor-like YbhB/YbcL family protein